MTHRKIDQGWVPPAGGPLWPGPDLLVPMAMDALLIGKPNLASFFAAVAPNYAAMELEAQVLPAPFSRREPQAGVHLHWTLPPGLRRGKYEDSGAMRFPIVPNRWLIVRQWYPAAAEPGTPPQETAWVVESDHQGEDVDDGTVPFPSPTVADAIVYLGRKVDYSGWSETAADDPQWLTAVGPGNQAFCATFDASLNVFSALDLPPEEAGSATYMVYGWNSDYSSDPLFGRDAADPNGWSRRERWDALVDALGWDAGNTDDAAAAWQRWRVSHPDVLNAPGQDALNPLQLTLPAQIVLHGMLFGVEWQGVEQNYPPSLPQTPALAIGETGNEALAALLADRTSPDDPVKAQTAERLMLAIGQGMTNQFLSDHAALEDALHSARFGSQRAGLTWIVDRPPSDDPAGQPGLGSQTVPLTEDETRLLIELNEAQAALDAIDRLLGANRWELYAASWKLSQVSPRDKPLKKKVQDAIDRLSAAIVGLEGTRSRTLAPAVESSRQALAAALGDRYLLSSSNAPPFYRANDPVILVAGTRPDTKHGDRGRLTGADRLPTRFTGQMVTRLTVSAVVDDRTRTSDVTAAQLVAALSPLEGGLLPKEVPGLLGEGMLLDPCAAPVIASLFYKNIGVTPEKDWIVTLAADVAKQQTAAWNAELSPLLDRNVLAAAAGFDGTVPARIAVEAWSQPWDPVFVDWSVLWYPTSADPAGSLAGWTLGDDDLDWDPKQLIGPQRGAYTGRGVISDRLPEGFAAQIVEFVNDPAAMAKLSDYQRQVLRDAAALMPTLDVVSQSLANFGDQMIMRTPEIIGPVLDEKIADLVRTPNGLIPEAGTVKDAPGFFPIKSGHFQIDNLWVVDGFGQILRGFPAGNRVAEPVRASSVVTPGDGRSTYMQVVPRYTQPARADFLFVSAKDDAVPSNSSDATSPIAGWIIVDHLDQALALFNPDGSALGELTVIDQATGSGARWDPAPGVQAPFGAPPSFPDAPHLQKVASGVLDAELRGIGALGDLLSIVDATLWQIDPQANRGNGNLALLAGAPIAVVRATLSLDPSGGPVFNQSWNDTDARQTNGYETVSFALRLGDVGFTGNGVIGYFLDDDYSRFYPVRGHSGSTGDFVRTLRLGARHTGTGIDRLHAAPGRSAAALDRAGDGYVVDDGLIPLAADGTRRRLTILMDPRGSAPLISGILPSQSPRLPTGPVDSALGSMAIGFRIGPLLTDPRQLRMPLPADIRGSWTWIEREGLTLWSEQTPAPSATAPDQLPANTLRLSQGWLKLSGAFATKPA